MSRRIDLEIDELDAFAPLFSACSIAVLPMNCGFFAEMKRSIDASNRSTSLVSSAPQAAIGLLHAKAVHRIGAEEANAMWSRRPP